uniref:Uncharacterized protein n=1 Tax=Arundo donax TaxID=35708 RepID=A0A0A9FLI7_ARUDO
MLTKYVSPFAPPCNALLVHHQRFVATGEAVRVIEQAPSYEPAGDNGASICSSFRFARSCVVDLLRISQLRIATALYIPSMVLVELVELIIYVDWLLHILRDLENPCASLIY